MEEKYYLVERKALRKLMIDSMRLRWLEAAGVDNWSGYGECRKEILNDIIHRNELVFDEDSEDIDEGWIVDNTIDIYYKDILELLKGAN